MSQPMIEWGGSGPALVFAPANGFPPAVYRPLLQRLSAQARIVLAPPRALWPGPPPLESGPDWATMAQDVLEGLAQERLGPVVALGHSLGAAAMLGAAARQPAAFRALVLLDPALLTPAMLTRGPQVLAQLARRRRAHFASREAAFAAWREKPLFHDWPDAALWAYVEGGLTPDGAGGLRLAWPPDWEAHYFETITPEIWSWARALPPELPVLLAYGAHSETVLPETLALLRQCLPQARLAEMPGGHLFPLTAPEETATLVGEALGLPPV